MSEWPGFPLDRLLVHHLGLFGRREVVDLSLEPLGQFLDLVLGLIAVVLGERLLFLALIGVLVGISADIADRHAGLFGQFLDP